MVRLPNGSYGALCAALALCVPTAHAQYPGHVDTTQQSQGSHLRATAVLEYTGDLADMKASRLVPVVVWDGLQYQPGGLYLAQPAPLAVLSGTQYELESDGQPKGFFNVKDAENLAGMWIGVGNYQAPAPPPSKLRASKHPPTVIDAKSDPDKPHFAHRPAPDNSSDQADTAAGASNAPAPDPDRPTLHSRSGDAGSSSTTASAPDIDPDRPTLHRHESPATTAAASQPAADPDRPHLQYTTPESQEKLEKPDALFGLPQDLKQIAAVSDTNPLDTNPFTYSWASPDDAAKMQSALEAIAEQALAPAAPAPSAAPKTAAAHAVSHRKAAAPAAPALPALTDEDFRVYSLTFGGGATMVLSARTGSDPTKYVTIIAQPDFYGKPQVLLRQVTTDPQLDVIPRMRLVDAVDTQGNGRADLIFELRGRTFRQFAIYRVAGGTATQVFLTQPASL